MSHGLRILLAREPGALLRVLLTIGRRGFELESLVARPGGPYLLVELVLTGDRDVGSLARCLGRQFDLRGVEVVT